MKQEKFNAKRWAARAYQRDSLIIKKMNPEQALAYIKEECAGLTGRELDEAYVFLLSIMRDHAPMMSREERIRQWTHE